MKFACKLSTRLGPYLLLSLSIVLVILVGCSTRESDQRPNIVWIIAEDLSQDLGGYGNERVTTPNLDTLARNGTKFTHVFTAAPICAPSRTALATGMHQGRIGAHHMRYPDSLKPALPKNIQTMYTHFQRNGYVTANITDDPGTGKVDWSFQADEDSQFGYEHWDALTNQEKPFFAQVSISYTHRPFPELNEASLDESIGIPPYYPNHLVSLKDFAKYHESIERLDEEVGRVLQSLKRHGVRKNTIVVFISDHGRPMPRGKSFLYDSGIRVPAIIHIPQQLEAPTQYQPGSTNNELLSAIDFSATSLSMAGIEKPESMHGRVFWGENQAPEREYVFSAVDRTGESHFKSRAIRSRRYKYIRNYRHDFSINEMATAYRKANHPIYHLLNILGERNRLDSAQSSLVEDLPAEELYDLKKDLDEINNLANDPRFEDTKKSLRKELRGHLQRIDDKGLHTDSRAIVRVFEEYGRSSYSQRKNQIDQLHRRVLNAVEANEQ
jgi:uncharacterized sulfatase